MKTLLQDLARRREAACPVVRSISESQPVRLPASISGSHLDAADTDMEALRAAHRRAVRQYLEFEESPLLAEAEYRADLLALAGRTLSVREAQAWRWRFLLGASVRLVARRRQCSEFEAARDLDAIERRMGEALLTSGLLIEHYGEACRRA